MPFKPGQSGNPLGVGKGTKQIKDKLNRNFVAALSSSFEAHGAKVIDKVIVEDPVNYLRLIASILPKELEVTSHINELSDEQLETIITTLQSAIGTGSVVELTEEAGRTEQAQDLSPLH